MKGIGGASVETIPTSTVAAPGKGIPFRPTFRTALCIQDSERFSSLTRARATEM